MSSLRRGHANLICIVPTLTDDPRRESKRAADLLAGKRGHSSLVALRRCRWRGHVVEVPLVRVERRQGPPERQVLEEVVIVGLALGF